MPRRRGLVPAWVPLAVVVLGGVWLAREIQTRAAAAGLERIELARSSFAAAPRWSDPRWQAAIAIELARAGDVRPSDRAGLEAAAARVAALPFVRQVSAPRVLWPAGVEFDVELRRPLACVRAGERFYPVDAEGRVLSGGWSSPPWVDSAHLPLLVDDPDAPPFAPGDALDGLHLVDALDVAVTMWEELAPVHRAQLGRIAIDARDARNPDPARPGVVLLLEGQRAVLFGRAPGRIAGGAPHQPGDLPVERRWAHVAAALERLASKDPAADWNHLDARFDTAALEPRLAPDAVLELAGGAFATRKGLGEDADATSAPKAGAKGASAASTRSTAPGAAATRRTAGRSGVR